MNSEQSVSNIIVCTNPKEDDNCNNESSSNRRLSDNPDYSDLMCACCYDLLHEPTTLTCGHTFCRSCIASWYLQSKQQSCPECRQRFHGIPQVNIMMRCILERQFPSKITQLSLTSSDNVDERPNIIREFEEALKRINDFHKRKAQMRNAISLAFCKGVIFTLALLLTMWLVSYILTPSFTASQRPLYKWTIDDTRLWLLELGPWVDYTLVPYFENNKIDGRLLMAMNDSDFENLLSDAPPLQRKAFNMSLNSVRDLGIKPPTNIWEFKSIYFGKSILLCYYLQYKPRLAIVALYVFEYSDLFLPFMHISLPKLNVSDVNLFTTEFPNPTNRDMLEFVITLIFMPYLLIGQLLYAHCGRLTATTWSSLANCAAIRMQLVNCAVLSALDINSLRILLLRSHNQRMSFFLVLRHEITDLFLKLILNALMIWLWWVIPSMIWNATFYVSLYALPFINVASLVRNIQY